MEAWLGSLNTPYTEELIYVMRMLIAGVLGGAIGFERTRKMRAAGLRTYILVCVGAALTMCVGLHLFRQNGLTDPARIAAQVVCGVGFIGAGTIMMTGYHRVHGLTTAAGLWAAGCLGLSVGAGMYVVSIAAFAVIELTMTAGSSLQERFLRGNRRIRLYILFEDAGDLKAFLISMREKHIEINDFEQVSSFGGCLGVSFLLLFQKPSTHREVMAMIAAEPGVAFIEEV